MKNSPTVHIPEDNCRRMTTTETAKESVRRSTIHFLGHNWSLLERHRKLVPLEMLDFFNENVK